MQVRALHRIADLFEQAQIAFIPLKGAVLRAYYPQPWMRTSADIDLLVHPENMTIAERLLESEGYQYVTRTDHDKSYIKGHIHIELHFATITSGYSSVVLRDIWEWANPKEGWHYQFVLQPEMIVFYHIAHMAKHFLVGGCGIRSFLDLKIIEDQIPYDRDIVFKLLSSAHLNAFKESSIELANYWFGDYLASEKLDLMEEYILKGGSYGITNNRFAVELAKGRNKGEYFLSRLFLPFNEMIVLYPVLKIIPIFLPLLWVHRWFVLFFYPQKRKESREKLKVLMNLSSSDREQAEAVLAIVGLEF